MTHRLAVDWGSSRLRVTRVPPAGEPEIRQGDAGAAALIGGGPEGFERALMALAGDWIGGCAGIDVAGMATARGGWRETPYVSCPADLDALPDAALHGRIGNVPLRFLPGLIDPAGPDVMRGEEAQLAALAVEGGGRRTVVLPGTHSKWVRLDGRTVLGFRTFMTGEIFDLVLRRSLAGRLAKGEAHDDAAFRAGLARGRAGDAFAALFSARPAVLTGALRPAGVAAYLSGACIASEIAQAAAAMGVAAGAGVTLCGAPALTGLYRIALEEAGLRVATVAPAG